MRRSVLASGRFGWSVLRYNIDREFGEFAVADLKKAIRLIATTRGVERVHILAHSRGTDVLADATQQLGIEAYVAQSSLWRRFHMANFVLFAPDIDMDVASTKMFGIVSDPDLSAGSHAKPFAPLPPQGPIHLTVYSSPNDRALGLSAFLFGSVLRLGQLAAGESPLKRRESAGFGDISQITGVGDFIEYAGNGGLIGHSYFLSGAAVKKDLVALIRDRRKAGDPARALVEVKRPFWRIVDKQQQARNSGRQLYSTDRSVGHRSVAKNERVAHGPVVRTKKVNTSFGWKILWISRRTHPPRG